MTKHPTKVYAHRGGREWAPENTMAAFRQSLELGVDGIELDVQRCSTGEIVVFHDHDIGRTTNGAGPLKNCSFDELQRLSAGLWFDKDFRGEKIPLLTDVLELIDGKVMLNIELKNMPIDYPGLEDDLIELLSEYPHMDHVVFSSFDNRLTKVMQQKRPDWYYAILLDGIPDDIVGMANSMGAKYWHPNYESLLKNACDEAKAAGILINVWTANDERDWARLLEMHVDGIMTDDPEGLINFLELVVKTRV
ncbi:MAG: glycerophosphodiester phosphodiesterase family protein [Candidatus Melainabacteria bacterium]|nr:glycerophosphodiester phosphodiesterase family protein [Candidatus Melainabacteria bacterium]